ncbi:Vacuolar protein-sorting-associated protein 36, partial [Ascosphaera acerosa]
AVQAAEWRDEVVVRRIAEWLDQLREVPPSLSLSLSLSLSVSRQSSGEGEDEEACPWDWRRFGRGVTAQEAAARFRWSVGVAAEELEIAEEQGVLCREENIEGTRFWRNYLAVEEET